MVDIYASSQHVYTIKTERVRMSERIGDGELAVMEALWEAGRKLTAAEIGEIVGPGKGWSESTVKTMLSRLVAKGAIAAESDGRRFLYKTITRRQDYAAGESRKLVDRLFGGRAAPLVAHLARHDGLSPEDLAELEALIKDLRK